jgi:hypothetical protein
VSTRTDRAATGRSRRDTRLGVVALLVPAAAWLGSLGLSYTVEDFTCSAAATSSLTVDADALRAVLLGLNAVLLVVALLAGWAGLSVARRSRGPHGSPLLSFLGYTGAGLALVFAFGILLIAWNPLVLEVCG